MLEYVDYLLRQVSARLAGIGRNDVVATDMERYAGEKIFMVDSWNLE